MKKTYVFFGNSTHTNDIAFMSAISLARKGLKTTIVELNENNAQLSYQLAIEKQRVKTTEGYLLNHEKYNIEDFLINSQIIIEDLLTPEEKSLKNEIEKLPDNLSILVKKAEPEAINFSEDEWENIMIKIKKDVLKNNDILIFTTTGRTFSYNVFFPIIHSDELILVVEDKPEDLRLINQFIIDMEKIKSNLSSKTIFLDYGISIIGSDFNKTKINVTSILKLKDIRNLKLATWEGYNRQIDEIENFTDKLLQVEKKKKFKLVKKKKKKTSEAEGGEHSGEKG